MKHRASSLRKQSYLFGFGRTNSMNGFLFDLCLPTANSLATIVSLHTTAFFPRHYVIKVVRNVGVSVEIDEIAWNT